VAAVRYAIEHKKLTDVEEIRRSATILELHATREDVKAAMMDAWTEINGCPSDMHGTPLEVG
jgi:hypothetical protein